MVVGHGLATGRARRHQLFLERVRERPVADVVQQRRGERAGHLVRRHHGARLAEHVERVVHERHRAQAVLEAGVDGAGEDQEAQAELPDPPQALHLGRVHKGHQQAFRDADESVDGIAEEGKAAGHGRGAGERPVPPTARPGARVVPSRHDASHCAPAPGR